MRAVYSTTPFKEIELSAVPTDWVDFSHALSQDGSIIQCERVVDPSPYQHFADRIIVKHQSGQKVEFQVNSDGNVIVGGDPKLLLILSQNATFPAVGLKKGYHIHIENYGSDDCYIGKQSIPTVFLLS